MRANEAIKRRKLPYPIYTMTFIGNSIVAIVKGMSTINAVMSSNIFDRTKKSMIIKIG